MQEDSRARRRRGAHARRGRRGARRQRPGDQHGAPANPLTCALRRRALRPHQHRHVADACDAGVRRLGERRPRREPRRPRRRHPLGQAVLHRGLRPHDLRPSGRTSRTRSCSRPGDNEWADCHKAAEGGGSTTLRPARSLRARPGDGLGRLRRRRAARQPRTGALDLLRRAGRNLGGGQLHVHSQATAYDPAHPADAAFVENVMWQRRGVLFVAVNVPGGSNNDTDPWFKTPTAGDPQPRRCATAPRPTCAGSTRRSPRPATTAPGPS